MANLNLLPWREERRQRRQREYSIILGVVAAVAALGVWLGQQYIEGQIRQQQQRNQFLQQQISQVQQQITQIKELQERREDVQARITIIQELQLSRTDSVRLVDTLARIVPVGVYLLGIERRDDDVFINAIAESNAQISKMMRNISSYEYLTDPLLSDIAQARNNDGLSFRISFRQVNGRPTEEDS